MLVIKNLHISIDKTPIVKGVSLTVKPGEIHAIMGPNGSGKSTLAQALMGHPSYKVKTQMSKVKINGQNILNFTPDQRAKAGLFLAFQYPVSVEGVSVQNFLKQAYQALYGKLVGNILDFRQDLYKMGKSVGVSQELLKRSLNEGFSGGEKKRLEVLQLLTLKPKYAILDETDSGLDIDAIKSVASGVKKAVKNYRTGIIIITHYQRILKYLKPDKVHLMVDGKIISSGNHTLAKQIEKTGYKKWQNH